MTREEMTRDEMTRDEMTRDEMTRDEIRVSISIGRYRPPSLLASHKSKPRPAWPAHPLRSALCVCSVLSSVPSTRRSQGRRDWPAHPERETLTRASHPLQAPPSQHNCFVLNRTQSRFWPAHPRKCCTVSLCKRLPSASGSAFSTQPRPAATGPRALTGGGAPGCRRGHRGAAAGRRVPSGGAGGVLERQALPLRPDPLPRLSRRPLHPSLCRRPLHPFLLRVSLLHAFVRLFFMTISLPASPAPTPAALGRLLFMTLRRA
jgi:hypothetical protein